MFISFFLSEENRFRSFEYIEGVEYSATCYKKKSIER